MGNPVGRPDGLTSSMLMTIIIGSACTISPDDCDDDYDDHDEDDHDD